MPINKYFNHHVVNQGFSLIEVLIAILILSIGLLATAAMQMNALQNTSNSEYRTQAVNLVMDMADKMQANYTEVLKDAATTPYDTSIAGNRCGGDAACVAAWNECCNIANLQSWINVVQNGIDFDADGVLDILPLPGGNAVICRDSNHDLFSNDIDSDGNGVIDNNDDPCTAAANVCDVSGTANNFAPYVIRVCWTEAGARRDVDGDGDIDDNDRDANQIIQNTRYVRQFSATLQ
ncbi:MAG: type IV pilus modification protein PilV [Gammaproteobacteria bacterium]|nr:type IV pilus modification protein PilV [Gammaproteobacteria bacterium]